MSSRVAALVDTNVLLYAYDSKDEVKQRRAVSLLEHLELRRTGALSVQVLGEFFAIATRKLTPPLSRPDTEWNVRAFARSWTVYDITATAVLEAMRGARDHQLPYWDGLIWATAKLNAVTTVLSEDFSDGQLLETVRFLNPFSPTFDLAALA